MQITGMFRFLLILAGTMLPFSAGAQTVVGNLPEDSPFRDLEHRQAITVFGGYYLAGKDPAGVAPRSGLMGGIRYEANVGGPISLFTRLSMVRSERQVIDPREPESSRSLGVQSWPLYAFDAGLGVNATGQRTWHRLAPALNVGIGFAFDANRRVEEDPFRFGTPFALVYGGSVRYVPGGRFQLRFGWDNYLYRLSYPTSYYVEPEGGDPVVPLSQSRAFWKNNMAFTLGGSLFVFR